MKDVEKITAHILCSIAFFFFKNRAVCESMWKNIVKRDKPKMAIRRIRIARWIFKATYIHSEYEKRIDSNNDRTNASQFYVIRTSPVLL
jgi:nitrogen regulatory protein PII-like uncharacterized protein